MPKLRKVGGAWRSVSARYRKIAGQWRRVKESYRKVDGVWVKILGSTYLQTYLNNPSPQQFEAGVYFDNAAKTYRAYINSKANYASAVEASIIIGNIPPDSKVQVGIRTYNNLTNYCLVWLTSNGADLGYISATNASSYTSRFNISGDLTLRLIYKEGNAMYQDVNFELFDVRINDVAIQLP